MTPVLAKPYFSTEWGGRYFVKGNQKAKMAEIIKPLRPKTVLDLGCGTGFFAHYLAMELPDSTVVGLDSDEEYLRLAKGQFVRENLSFGYYDLEKGARERRKFDVIILSEVIEHMPDCSSVIRRIRREFCRKGTVLVVSTDNAFSIFGLCGELYRSFFKPKIKYNEWYEMEGRHVHWSHHLYTWDTKSLATLFHVNGFSTTAYHHCLHVPVRCDGWRIPFTLITKAMPALREKILLVTVAE